MPAAAMRLINSFDIALSLLTGGRVEVVVAVPIFEFGDLALRFVLRDAIRLLQLAGELVALAGDGVEAVVGETAPLLLDLALELLPVAFNSIPVHCLSPRWRRGCTARYERCRNPHAMTLSLAESGCYHPEVTPFLPIPPRDDGPFLRGVGRSPARRYAVMRGHCRPLWGAAKPALFPVASRLRGWRGARARAWRALPWDAALPRTPSAPQGCRRRLRPSAHRQRPCAECDRQS